MNNKQNTNRSKKTLDIFQYIIVGIVAAAVIVAAACFVLANRDYKNADIDETANSSVITEQNGKTEIKNTGETEATEQTSSNELDEKYTVINKLSSEINKGSLILVSNVYNYVTPEKNNRINVYKNKSNNYTLSTTTTELEKEAFDAFEKMLADFTAANEKYDVIITSAYRSAEEQAELYNKAVKADGENQNYVSKPNAGDTQTGLGLDIKVYSEHKMKKITEDEDYKWITENYYKYGFIERYPESKTDITGIQYSGGLYLRYVGIPHSYAMKQSGMCLEEYVLSLKDYTYDTEHLVVDVEGATYEIYYSAVQEGKTSADIYVPADKPYTVTGTNVDGFAVSFVK